jgi:mRNA interferase MazF
MATFDRWDVVAVPFPYVGRLQTKRRPAVVVSGQRWLRAHGLLWVAMVTSAVHAPWPDDVPIRELDMAGLAKASMIRPAKIATVEARRCERLGRLAVGTCQHVEAALRDGMIA